MNTLRTYSEKPTGFGTSKKPFGRRNLSMFVPNDDGM